MRRQALILVADASPTDAEMRGDGTNEHVREDRAGTTLRNGNGKSPWPTVGHLWAGADLCGVGMPHPSLDLQPDNSLLTTRSPASLNTTSLTQSSVPTLATLRRLTIRVTPLSQRKVGGRISAGSNGAPC
jgi:hypothetical protein